MKIFNIILILTFGFALVSCQTNAPSDEQKVVPAVINGLTEITQRADEEKPDLFDGVTLYHSLYDASEITLTIDDQVAWNVEGVHYLTYIAETPYGMITRANRMVTILPERDVVIDVYPVITGLEHLIYTIGDPMPDLLEGISALDVQDGTLTDITVDDATVDYTSPGVYQIFYEVTNSRSLTTQQSIQITVVEARDQLNIVYINDVHGAILPTDSAVGFSATAALLDTLEQADPDRTLFISGGDILQGNIISNYFYGASVIEALNAMDHAAFIVGNHEFDWGIEEVTKFFIDGESEVQANFPLLAANIFYKGTSIRPEGMEPYTIVERAGYRIGIIGTIGFGLESSIAVSRVEDYEFTDPVSATETYATYLRQSENVDLVIAVTHGSSSVTNDGFASLSGDATIDFIFNGHSHQTYASSINQNGRDISVLQAGGYGSGVGFIEVSFIDGIYDDYTSVVLDNSDTELSGRSTEVESVINGYYTVIQSLLEDEIILSNQSYTRSQLTTYMATLIAKKTGAVIGIHNYGGTRTDISYREPLTIAKVYEIFPFDNVIKTVELLGSQVLTLEGMFGASDVYRDMSVTIDPDTYYKVATNDYIFDQPRYPFIYGQNILDTSIMIRDVLVDELYAQKAVQDYFMIDDIVSLRIDVALLITMFRKERWSTYGSVI
jgi:2',3'-cyclic-nucleotide 2'-phosphodiesterase (5'-nucleotidase family)